MLVAITGATGHLGLPTVRRLLETDHRVRVLKRQTSNISSIEHDSVEFNTVSFEDPTSLRRALKGVDVLLHLASRISVMPLMKDQLLHTNLTGTQNLLSAAIAEKVRRLVYVSSIHAIPSSGVETQLDEAIELDEGKVYGDYGYSKALATKLILRAALTSPIETLVLCPTGIVGPFDKGTSHMGKVIRDYIRKRLPFYLDGGYNFVDVRDVADVLVKSVLKGRVGQHYLLGGDNVSLKDLFHHLGKITEVRYPQFPIPFSVANALAYPNAYLHRSLRLSTLFTPDSIRTLRENGNICSKLAADTFDFHPISWKKSIEDQVAWYRSDNP